MHSLCSITPTEGKGAGNPVISIRQDAVPTSGEQPGNVVDPQQWVDRHGDTLYRFALSRLRDAEAAEEVVQETFVAALRARDQYSGKAIKVLRRCHAMKEIIKHISSSSHAGPQPLQRVTDLVPVPAGP